MVLGAMSSVSRLPVEVLGEIFQAAKHPHPFDTWLPQCRLARLTRVCKHWRPIAERLLYESVAIGSDLDYTHVHTRDHEAPSSTAVFPALASPEYYDWLADMMEKSRAYTGPVRHASFIIRHFLETVQEHRRLAAIVTELQLLLPNEDKPEEESHKLVEILIACPNLRHMKIIIGSSFHPNAGKMLIEPIMSKEKLVSFELVSVDPTGEGWETLWNLPTILRMMRKWRHIEHVQTSHNTLPSTDPDDEDDEDNEDDDSDPGCCPTLQTIDFGRSWNANIKPAMLRSRDIRNLLRMCPLGLITFKAPLAMDDGTLDVLGDCVRAWAPTLEMIVLRTSERCDSPTVPARLSESVGNLTRLKVLVLENLILEPRILSMLPNLMHLCVAWPSMKDKRDLLFAMSKARTFPALRTLHIGEVESADYDDEEEQKLEALMEVIIKIRGIRLLDEDADIFS